MLCLPRVDHETSVHHSKLCQEQCLLEEDSLIHGMNDWRPFVYGGLASIAAECGIRLLLKHITISLHYFKTFDFLLPVPFFTIPSNLPSIVVEHFVSFCTIHLIFFHVMPYTDTAIQLLKMHSMELAKK